MTTAGEKKELRRRILALLRSMNAIEREQASNEIRQKLCRDEEVAQAGIIAVFSPLNTEPDILPMFFSGHNQRICFPRVDGKDLAFHEVGHPGELVAGSFGVREPDPTVHRAVEPAQIDAILVPGLAFDPKSGLRLGRGGGFYDRFLLDRPPAMRAIGICFCSQLRESLPFEPFDVPVDRIITDGDS